MGRNYTGPRLLLVGGIYYIAWQQDGRSKRATTGTANLPEAQRVLAHFLLEQERAAADADRWTVKMVCAYYDANHIEAEVEDKDRQRRALSYIKSILGEDTFIDALDAESITGYRAERKRQRRVKYKGTANKWRVIPGANDATLRRELNTFLAACNFAVRNRKIDNRAVPAFVLPDHNAGRDRWLTQDEATHLMIVAQPPEANRLTRERRLIGLAIGTMRRRRAIETLQWFRVDLKNRIIDFRRPGEPETKKRRGIAAIPDWLIPDLERAYSEKVSEYVLDEPDPLTRAVRAVCDAAGMTDASAHTLRHTGGTWAAQAGMSMWEIAGAMGCTVATAERNYLHHSPDHLRKVANRAGGNFMARAKA